MSVLMLTIGLLTLITVVYFTAYKSGYKAAQAKAASAVQELSVPVGELIDKLNQSVDQAIAMEKAKGE